MSAPKYADRDVGLIDESHNFRHEDTQRYKRIQPFLHDKRVVMLTATPRNTSRMRRFNGRERTCGGS